MGDGRNLFGRPEYWLRTASSRLGRPSPVSPAVGLAGRVAADPGLVPAQTWAAELFHFRVMQ